jgi:hypothetical protein
MKAQQEQIKNLKVQQQSLEDELKAEQTFLSTLVKKNNTEHEPQELEDLSLVELNVKTKVMCEVLQQSLEAKIQEIRELSNDKENLERQLFNYRGRLSKLVLD